MPTNTQANTQAKAATTRAYEDKIKSQVTHAKAQLDQLEATAREKKAQAEITAIAGLKTTKQSIDQRLQDLKATSDANMSRAKAAIDTDVTKFKASIDSVAAKVKPHASKK